AGWKYKMVKRVVMWGLLARPGDDPLSHPLWGSTLGAARFHGRVRNGIGWVPRAVVTRSGQQPWQMSDDRCQMTGGAGAGRGDLASWRAASTSGAWSREALGMGGRGQTRRTEGRREAPALVPDEVAFLSSVICHLTSVLSRAWGWVRARRSSD